MSEEILYEENPSMFKNEPITFIVFVLLIVVGIGVVFLLIWYLKTKATKLTVTNSMVTLEKGLLSKEHSELYIDTIRTVKVKQSFFNRIFGVGSLQFYTAGDSPEVVVNGMPDPHKIREIIKSSQR